MSNIEKAIESAARALCLREGNLENTKFESNAFQSLRRAYASANFSKSIFWHSSETLRSTAAGRIA